MHPIIRRFTAASSALAALATLTLAQLPIAAPLHEPDCRERRPPPDPTVQLEYGCYFFGNYVWNDASSAGNVEGRIYWPSSCETSTPPGVHPLVLLMHGDGHDQLDYGYLMSHLARNGFIAATISNGGTNLERTGQALTFLSFIRNHWTHRLHVANNIGLIGHSRGGEAVLTLARRIGELGLSHNVNAIISLAPTDNDEGGGGVHESLDGGESESFLVIYGTDDEDVYGRCVSGTLPGCGDPAGAPMRTGFALYDRAGSEGGTEPFPVYDDVVTKSMLFVERANHNRWRSTCTDGAIFDSLLSCDTHWNIAKGYMNAFLRWRLRGQKVFKNFFTGRWMPPAVEADGARIHTQYSEGYGRRVLDNFEQNTWQTNSLGGSVTSGGAIQVVLEGSTWGYEPTSTHDTESLVVTWAPPGLAPWLRWSIPNGTTAQGARFRDVSDFGFFSFRAGQVFDSSFNAAETPKDLYVEFRDSGNNTSTWVRASDYAELPYPREAQVLYAGILINVAKSAMNTVRIPICDVEGVDLENISEVRLYFSVPGSNSGELLIDNLEFAN
ncbi:MAG: hypothetical protein ACKVWV_17250 [Planctomycetota bacterium]